MSVKDLLVNWEEALGQALSQPSGTVIELTELRDCDLENAAAPHVRSGVHAGDVVSSFHITCIVDPGNTCARGC